MTKMEDCPHSMLDAFHDLGTDFSIGRCTQCGAFFTRGTAPISKDSILQMMENRIQELETILESAIEVEYVGDGTFIAGDEDCFKAGIKQRNIYQVITK